MRLGALNQRFITSKTLNKSLNHFQPMQAPRIYNLGEFLVTEGLVSEIPLTKQALSEALNTTRTTIWRYDRLAFWLIPDYKQEYPEIPRELRLAKKASRDVEVPLSPYQVWVLSAIQACFKALRTELRVREYIEKSTYVFSKAKYSSRMKNLIAEAQKSQQSA